MPETAVVGATTTDASTSVSGGGTPTPSSNGPESPSQPVSSTNAEPAGGSLATELAKEMRATRSGERPGWIPQSRHDEVLKNARDERERAEQELRSRYSWADDIEPNDAQAFKQLFQDYRSDPFAVARRIMAAADPQAVRSYAGQLLNAGRQTSQPAAPPPDPEPQPDVEYNGVQWYSVERQREHAAWVRRQAVADIRKELAPELQPLLQERRERQQREEAAAEEQERNDIAASQYASVKDLPLFQEHAQEIKAAFSKMPFRNTYDLQTNLIKAWTQIALPKLGHATTQKVLSDLDAKARASTTHPTRSTVATPSDAPLSFKDVIREEVAKQRAS